MIAFDLRCALERNVVGQSRAVRTVVRAVSIALGGLAPAEGPVASLLFLGPAGAGKTHLARSLVKLLHGDASRLVVAECLPDERGDAWAGLMRQVAPHFRQPFPGREGPTVAMAPLSVVLVEHLERLRPELVQALVRAFNRGYLSLPDGRHASLAGCLVLMTSNLCSREIHDAGRQQEIGFSPSADDLEEGEKARVYQQCVAAVEKRWGPEVLGYLDDLVVFHRLRKGHLPFILDRLVAELNGQLAGRGIVCEPDPDALRSLISRAEPFLRQGARIVDRVFRRFVVFPVADMLHGDGVPPGSRIRVELEGERLRFEVVEGPRERSTGAAVASTGPHRSVRVD